MHQPKIKMGKCITCYNHVLCFSFLQTQSWNFMDKGFILEITGSNFDKHIAYRDK
jgi:hypothetical protein